MPDPARVMIADDEPLARERLRTMLRHFGGFDVVAECGDGPSTVQAVMDERPEVVLLDIRMPGLDGVEVAQVVEALDPPRPAIVFVTAFDEFALKAFDLEAADYVLKPVDRDRLRRALDRALGRTPAERTAGLDARTRHVLEQVRGATYPRRFVVRGVHGLYFVQTADVEWIDAQGNYARLHAKARAHLLRMTMKALERQLDPAQFVRIHRSAIVNIDSIERVEPYTHGEYLVTLRDGTRLTSSKAHSQSLKELLDSPAR